MAVYTPGALPLLAPMLAQPMPHDMMPTCNGCAPILSKKSGPPESPLHASLPGDCAQSIFFPKCTRPAYVASQNLRGFTSSSTSCKTGATLRTQVPPAEQLHGLSGSSRILVTSLRRLTSRAPHPAMTAMFPA